MNLQSNFAADILDRLTCNEIKNLTIETIETIATQFIQERKRIFSAAELWHIQRTKRNVSSRRLYL